MIRLQETWIYENDDISPFHFQGYDCMSQGKTCTSKGGLVIYVDAQYKSKVTFNLNTYEHWEGLIVKVLGNCLSKTFTIGNIYRSPRTRNEDLNVFIDEFTTIITRLYICNNDIIIPLDFNINLTLNKNEMFSSFFDTVIPHSLYPQITLPTRFTRTTGTMIDNLFC